MKYLLEVLKRGEKRKKGSRKRGKKKKEKESRGQTKQCDHPFYSSKLSP